MNEFQIENDAVRFAEKAGWLVRKLKWTGRTGAPDRMFVRDGRIVMIEFKAPGNMPRADQRREIAELRDAGVAVYVCDSLEKAMEALDA